MSFGCSASDITQAITIVVKTVKALDAASAPAYYREALAFFGGLMRTLQPLHTYTTLGARPSYQNEIKEHVSNIKYPIESFLSTIAKYEPSLGANAIPGYRRNIYKKLKWRFVISKSVIDLRQEIQDHMLLLDYVLQRLTVDLLVDIQSKVGDGVRNVLSDALDPRLLSILQEQLHPVRTMLSESSQREEQRHQALISKIEDQLSTVHLEYSATQLISGQQHSAVVSEMREREEKFIQGVHALKDHISTITKTIQSKEFTQRIMGDQSGTQVRLANNTLRPPLRDVQLSNPSYCYPMMQKSYQAFNHLIKIAEKCQPTSALTPVLIDKYHISFYDAIGRAPRILDYECFKTYHVFDAFLRSTFFDTPGATWVERGLYELINTRLGPGGTVLSPTSWSSKISPGSRVYMSMLIKGSHSDGCINGCPLRNCSGILEEHSGVSDRLCSVCGIEVCTSINDAKPDDKKPSRGHRHSNNGLSQAGASRNQKIKIADGPEVSTSREDDQETVDTSVDINLDSIIHFKRVALVLDAGRSPNSSSKKQSPAKSEESSSLPPNSTEPTRPNISFLFTVSSVHLNEDPSNGGVAPKFDNDGRWSPPIYQAGFASQKLGVLYRWKNGVVSHATGYQWNQKGAWWGPEGVAALYRANTMFYCNPFDQSVAAEGDATNRDMGDAPHPNNRWYTLRFHHQSALSRLDLGGPEPYLASKLADHGSYSINQLGLTSWYDPDPRSSPSTRLAGNLALLIALVAFSCRSARLDTVLRTSWIHYEWRPHVYTPGRNERRGVVVNIYYDPENPTNSTEQTLSDLEWTGGQLII